MKRFLSILYVDILCFKLRGCDIEKGREKKSDFF